MRLLVYYLLHHHVVGIYDPILGGRIIGRRLLAGFSRYAISTNSLSLIFASGRRYPLIMLTFAGI